MAAVIGGQAGAPPRSSTWLVVAASTLGTVFEWYDFFVYGTLAAIIGQHFFPAGNASISLLITLGTFGVGFGMRPVGAVLFGVLGDRLGRKYTFLITVGAMGGATAAVGLLPTYQQIGISASILLLVLRVIQGLALGGEYGGAAVYVAEHAPAEKRGFYTSFINAGAAGGFLLSLCVVLVANAALSKEDWAEWGWRVPFLFSLVLLALSLCVRMLLHESPVFATMQAEGTVARNPLRESFDSVEKWKKVCVALFGVAAGLTVTYYTAQFQSLYFVQNAQQTGNGYGIGVRYSFEYQCANSAIICALALGSRLAKSPQNTPTSEAPFSSVRFNGSDGIGPDAKPTTK